MVIFFFSIMFDALTARDGNIQLLIDIERDEIIFKDDFVLILEIHTS